MQNEGIGYSPVPFLMLSMMAWLMMDPYGHAAGIGTGLWHACWLMACFHHGSGQERACVEGACVVPLMSRIRFQGGNRIGLRGSFS